MCFLIDPQLRKNLCYVQFPQRFHGIDRSDRYANGNNVFVNFAGVQSQCQEEKEVQEKGDDGSGGDDLNGDSGARILKNFGLYSADSRK
ncbi:unnamed protein product [Microthlaspi erraticum]|uniref:Uncharacterized protein n=1 Tax=Microthlaspi erraticum TaxID=1685480 RepID=A0A6D2L0W0_9BRAS|nr:unnamed protein product [Microthlaspi erraticum]